jgi:hypothetical protein
LPTGPPKLAGPHAAGRHGDQVLADPPSRPELVQDVSGLPARGRDDADQSLASENCFPKRLVRVAPRRQPVAVDARAKHPVRLHVECRSEQLDERRGQLPVLAGVADEDRLLLRPACWAAPACGLPRRSRTWLPRSRPDRPRRNHPRHAELLLDVRWQLLQSRGDADAKVAGPHDERGGRCYALAARASTDLLPDVPWCLAEPVGDLVEKRLVQPRHGRLD